MAPASRGSNPPMPRGNWPSTRPTATSWPSGFRTARRHRSPSWTACIDDGAQFDVIRIVPEGGRPFQFWINSDTHLIERLVEREAQETRTEYLMDLRDVEGVKVPHRVRATRGDPRQDEVITVDKLDYNWPLTGVVFAQPAARAAGLRACRRRRRRRGAVRSPRRAHLRHGHAERQGPVPDAAGFRPRQHSLAAGDGGDRRQAAG